MGADEPAGPDSRPKALGSDGVWEQPEAVPELTAPLELTVAVDEPAVQVDAPAGPVVPTQAAESGEPPEPGESGESGAQPEPGEPADTVPSVEPAPVEPGPARWPSAVSLLNATGLSLGYWYLGRLRRAVGYLVGTAALVGAAFLADAAHHPWLWRAGFAGWAAWLAFDGWRLARRHPGARTAPKRRDLLVAVVAVVAVSAGYLGYGVAGRLIYDSGASAQAEGDCGTAVARYDLVTGPFELTLSDNVAAAERNRGFCSRFLVAARRQDHHDFSAAVAGYREFLERTPSNSLDGPAHERIRQTYLDWARSARAERDYLAAIGAYLELLKESGGSTGIAQTRTELAQTYLDEAAEFRSRFETADGVVDVADVRRAMMNYLLVLDTYGETAPAASVPQAIGDAFTAATRPFTSGRYCESLPTLKYLVGIPADHAADMVAAARQSHSKAAYECGVQRYSTGAFEEAASLFETVTSKYPDGPDAAAAGSASIAATIAATDPDMVPDLPPPLGGNSPGPISLTFYNDSSVPVEVLLSGPTAHRFVIPGCPSCPEFYDNKADACPTVAGKPSVVLHLKAGSYYLLNRDADRTNRPGVDRIRVPAFDSYCLFRYQKP